MTINVSCALSLKLSPPNADMLDGSWQRRLLPCILHYRTPIGGQLLGLMVRDLRNEYGMAVVKQRANTEALFAGINKA